MDYQPADRYFISDIDTLKILANQRRLRILEELGKDSYTVEGLAGILNLAPDTVLDDIQLLKAYDLIQVVQAANGPSQEPDAKAYRASARRYVIDENLEPLEDPSITNATLRLAFEALEQTRQELIYNVDSLLAPSNEDGWPHREFGKGRLFLTRSEAQDLARDLEAIWDKYRKEKPGPNTDEYSLLMVFLPTPNFVPVDSEDS